MSNGQDHSGLSPSGISGSGSHNESGAYELPLEQAKLVFTDFFDGALVFGVLKPGMLLERFPPIKVLGALKEDRERIADIVSATTGMHKNIVQRRFDLERFAEDIQAGIEADATEDESLDVAASQVGKIFINAIGVDFFLQHMELKDLYEVVMGTGWMLMDSAQNRAFAASLCKSLVKHKAFGGSGEGRTFHNIMKAITVETLMSDQMPPALRTRLMGAVVSGGNKWGNKRVAEYMFNPEFNGVTFIEMGEHLPVEALARPFAAYVDELGIVQTQVERPSEMPPSDHPAVSIEGGAAEGMGFPVPKPPPLVHQLPASTANGAPPPMYGPESSPESDSVGDD